MTKNYFAHPSSIIDENVIIGKGTSIWHFSHIMQGAVIGKKCNLGQNTFIGSNVIIGNGVKIQNNVSVYTGVELEDDVFIGPSVVFTNVINPRSFIERKEEFRKTLVKKGSSIGANATIISGITIGIFAMVGAGAVITKNVSPYSIVVGNPAIFAGWISETGHKLHFNAEGRAICEENKHVYIIRNNVVSRL